MSKSLTISDLHVTADGGKEILKGVSLRVKPGEVHTIMGPNGSGKSTLAQTIMGHPFFTVTRGSIELDGEDITKLSTDKRARMGLFLGNQNPVEVDGVNFVNFLRVAVSSSLREGEKKLTPRQFRELVTQKAEALSFNSDILKRNLNEGFSGGEKKKAEIMQLALLKPKYAILDEPDSGLDVDGMKYIGQTIEEMSSELGLLIITHYQRILKHIKPDYVHILVDGRIVETGGVELMNHIDGKGFKKYLQVERELL
jgi:Fe-S cluster assembly ATP-binding protein